MTRTVYRGLLWLHPVLFKEQFGEELLWIFDLRRQSELGVALVLDGVISLCRQWLLRSGLWKLGVGVLVNMLVGHRLIWYCLSDLWRLAEKILTNFLPMHRLILYCSGLSN